MFYSLYSQTVESSVSLEEFGLRPIDNPSLSEVIKMDFIAHRENELPNYVNHQTNSDKDYGYYYMEDIALFEIFSGKKIVIRYFNDIDSDLIHSLLNYPFAILFNQRKKYVIHASSVFFRNKVFCFCGKTQSGKSSLASHLLKMGGSLISEDTSVFDLKDNDPVLLPSYNFIKISDEVNSYKDNSFENPIKFFKKSSDRKGYMLDDNKFYTKQCTVDFFIYLNWSQEAPNLRKLNDEESLKFLFLNELLSFSKDDAASRFKVASTLVAMADHFLFSREKELLTLDNFVEIFSKRYL